MKIKKTMYLMQDVIDRGEFMATARRISFSKLIEELVNENYKVANIISNLPSASEVKMVKAYT